MTVDTYRYWENMILWWLQCYWLGIILYIKINIISSMNSSSKMQWIRIKSKSSKSHPKIIFKTYLLSITSSMILQNTINSDHHFHIPPRNLILFEKSNKKRLRGHITHLSNNSHNSYQIIFYGIKYDKRYWWNTHAPLPWTYIIRCTSLYYI